MLTPDEFRRVMDKYNIRIMSKIAQGVSSCRSLNLENDDKNGSATLLDLEALDCPICCDTLTTPIIQCDNGHIACSTCCNKLRNKCPSCALPIGHIRSRAMERVLESVVVPCSNAKFGCRKKVSYGNESTHEKKCAFSLCTCPSENCNYTGSYKDLYSHFDIHKAERRHNYRLIFGGFAGIYFEFTKYNLVVMKECKDGLLFVVQCFREPHGICVTVSCVAPCALEVGEFSCHISAVEETYNMTFELPKVKRVRELSLETPEDDFLLVPSYFLRGRQALKVRVCICKLNDQE